MYVTRVRENPTIVSDDAHTECVSRGFYAQALQSGSSLGSGCASKKNITKRMGKQATELIRQDQNRLFEESELYFRLFGFWM